MNILDSFFDSPIVIVILIVALFGLVVLAVILIKKYVPYFKNEEGPKTPEEIAAEEVARLVVDVDEEKDEELEAASREFEEETSHEEKDYTEEELARSIRTVEDEEALKAMERYAEEHPEEAEAALKAKEEADSDKK